MLIMLLWCVGPVWNEVMSGVKRSFIEIICIIVQNIKCNLFFLAIIYSSWSFLKSKNFELKINFRKKPKPTNISDNNMKLNETSHLV